MSQKTPIINRVTDFVKALMLCVRDIPCTYVNKLIIEQLLRASTSIGANYHEALEAESRRDFIHKMGVCKKEARETMYWIDLLMSQEPAYKTKLDKLQSEVDEFVRIFAKSQMTARSKLV